MSSQQDDYGVRPDGAHNCWVARLVRPPFTVDKVTLREFHGGQVAASAGHHTRTAAIAAARDLIARHRSEWERGAHAVVEPGFASAAFMPGAERLEWER